MSEKNPDWKDSMYYTGGNGRRVRENRGAKEVLFSLNRVQQSSRYGREREPMDLYQGARSGSVKASGSTHSGWDAWDRSAYNSPKRSQCARIHGVMDHTRTPSQGPWVKHGHAGVDGGAGSASLQGQIAGYHRDDDGLRGSARDRGFEMRNEAGNRIFPLYAASWRPYGKHGIYVADLEFGAYEYQSPSSKRLLTVKKGQELSISAVTVVVNSDGRHLWGITDTKGSTPGGEVVYLKNLSLVKEVSPWLT